MKGRKKKCSNIPSADQKRLFGFWRWNTNSKPRVKRNLEDHLNFGRLRTPSFKSLSNLFVLAMETPETAAGATDSSGLITSSPQTNVSEPVIWEDVRFEKILEDTKTVSMVFYPLLCVIAALGNSCVVYLILSRRRMRSNVTNYFIAR